MNFKRKETRLWRIPLFNSTLQLFILVVETVERFQKEVVLECRPRHHVQHVTQSSQELVRDFEASRN